VRVASAFKNSRGGGGEGPVIVVRGEGEKKLLLEVQDEIKGPYRCFLTRKS